MDAHLEANRAVWDAWADAHVRGCPGYPVDAFKAGQAGMTPNTPDDLGPVAGKDLLHLQCHFGMDTLMWARQGAQVTGVDFSSHAIAHARRLSVETGLDARFVESDIAALADQLDGTFDIVLTYYGVLPWLPDLKPWARTIARFLRPGGFFYLADTHPAAEILAIPPGGAEPVAVYDYFPGAEPIVCCTGGSSYAVAHAGNPDDRTYEWQHSLQDILGALLDVGLCIDYLHEFPYAFFNCFATDEADPMEQTVDGWWILPRRPNRYPLMFSLKATKRGAPR